MVPITTGAWIITVWCNRSALANLSFGVDWSLNGPQFWVELCPKSRFKTDKLVSVFYFRIIGYAEVGRKR
jgi:hypothetical protein